MQTRPENSLHRLAQSRPRVTQLHRNIQRPGKDVTYDDRINDAVILHEYPGEMWLGGTRFAFQAGAVSLIPVGTRRVFRAQGSGWHRVLNIEPGPLSLPIRVFQAGATFASLCQVYDEALRTFPTLPSRAELKAWELLWNLGDDLVHFAPQVAASALVQRALQELELQLSEPFKASRLARTLGVSPSHLSRAFHREVGTPLVRWMRSRRMALAERLLRQTTLPVKEVAAACGLGDAQWFNKTVRRHFGRSPSEVRRGA